MQTTHQTSHGQLLDLITAPIGTVRSARARVSQLRPERLRDRGASLPVGHCSPPWTCDA